jgi:hypothetical protein
VLPRIEQVWRLCSHLLCLWHDTQLLQHCQGILFTALLDDLPINDPVDGDAPPLGPLAGRGKTREVSLVGPSNRPARSHFVPLGDHVIDATPEVWKGVVEAHKELFVDLRAMDVLRKEWIADNEIGSS